MVGRGSAPSASVYADSWGMAVTSPLPVIITFPFSPVLVQLGPVTVRWYGVCYAVAFLIGLWIVGGYAKAQGIPERRLGNLGFWAIVVGLLAARLYYVLQSNFGWYVTHPQHILAFWEGGMAYYGAIFAVPVLIVLYSRRHHLNAWILLDAAALFAAAGQPIGRIGNIVNGEADVLGPRSDLPWAFAYTNPQSMAPRLGVGYQPAGLYELLLGLAILGILLFLRWRIPLQAGALFVIYLLLYAVSQFGIFFLRQNPVTLWGLKQAQLTSLAVIAVTLALMVFRQRTKPHPAIARVRNRPACDSAPATGAQRDHGDRVGEIDP